MNSFKAKVLILNRSDLNYQAQSKNVYDITIADIAKSIDPINKAELVLFVDTDNITVIILKKRYDFKFWK